MHEGITSSPAPRVPLFKFRAVRGVLVIALLLAFGAVLGLPLFVGPYILHIFILTFFTAALTLSFRPLLTAGQISVAHGALFAIGAYTSAILIVNYQVSFWLALLASGVVAVVAAILIGLVSLRVSGPYFFLITFAFSVVVLSAAENFQSLTGGFSGIAGIPYPPGILTVGGFFYLALASLIICFGLFWVLDRSRWGLELKAIGESADLAEAAGISRFATLLSAFAIGALIAGLFGALYAAYLGFIAPPSFGLSLSIAILTAAIVAGARYVWGPVLGAAIITLIPEVFSWDAPVNEIFGAAVVVMTMMVLPRGLATELTELFAGSPGAGDVSTNRDAQPTLGTSTAGGRTSKKDVVLDVKGLSRRFGGVQAVANLSFNLKAGEILGLVGPNGSGKTTTLNLLSGFVRADSGTIRLRGADVNGLAAHEIVRHGLTRSFQSSTTFDDLTAFQNVLLSARAGILRNQFRRYIMPFTAAGPDQDEAWKVLELTGLTRYASWRAGDLSYGQKKRLGLAISVASQTPIVCLDEPATGLTDTEVGSLIETIRLVHRERNVSFIIVEHRLAVIRALCDRVIVLASGALLAEGSPEDVLNAPAVIEAYIGKSAA